MTRRALAIGPDDVPFATAFIGARLGRNATLDKLLHRLPGFNSEVDKQNSAPCPPSPLAAPVDLPARGAPRSGKQARSSGPPVHGAFY